MPRVSVVMASYNHERFVAEAMRSVLNQTVQDFEFIIVDDGSHDGTAAVIRTFDDPRIRFTPFAENRSACVALNSCIREASGEFIAVINSDDAWEPERLERQLTLLEARPEVGAAFSYVTVVDEQGQPFTARGHYYTSLFDQVNRSRHEWLRHFFFWDNCLCHPSLLIRRVCYETLGLYDERLAQLPDMDFWVRLCSSYEISILPERLVRFRILSGEANASSQGRPQARSRHHVEVPRVLAHYVKSPLLAQIGAIFPEIAVEAAKTEPDLVPFLVALQAARSKSPSRHSFALDVIYELLSNPDRTRRITEQFQFSYNELIALAGEIDVYGALSTQALHERYQELHATREELERALGETRELHGRFAAQTELLSAQTHLATAYRTNLDEQARLVQSLEGQLADKARLVQSLEGQLVDKARLVQSLDEQIAALHGAVERSQAELTRLQGELATAAAIRERQQRLLTHERATLQRELRTTQERVARFEGLLPVRAARKARRILRQTPAPVATPLIEAHLDLPHQGSVLAGVLEVYGWALSRAGAIVRVEAFLDGSLVGEVPYGHPRPDVAVFKQQPELAECGFLGRFQIDTADLSRTDHTVTVRFTDSQGNHRDVNVGVKISDHSYRSWTARNSPEVAQLTAQREQAAALAYRPLISVLVPVYNTPEAVLRATIDSVLAQTYDRWELILADGASPRPEVRAVLQEFAQRDKRIVLQLLEANRGIANNTNAALERAQGEFVALLDHDDLLTPDALFEQVALLNVDPEADAIYSDQDKIDEHGRRFEPFFKPDWSPELFRGVMYVGHLLCVRRSIALGVGGFLAAYDGVQDYEFMLRVSEATDKIRHIPKILYHWRTLATSIASRSDAKSAIDELQQQAVNAHLRRMGLHASAAPGGTPHRVRIAPQVMRHQPRVSIVIPSRNAPDLLRRCLESIYEQSSYRNFEVVLVDNESDDRDAIALTRHYPVRRVYLNSPFNYSRANNIGARYGDGECLLFLNNDTEVLSPDWLEQLLYYSCQEDVGAAGGLLLYPDRTVQHAGIVLGIRGTADHVMRGFPENSDGYAGSLACAREVSAVTGACLMVTRADFEQVGGFDEHYFTHYQDVDLCLMLRRLGRRNIYVPGAKLLHYESVTRKTYYDHVDRNLLLDRWQEAIEGGDPYYNPNFDLRSYSYTVRLD